MDQVFLVGKEVVGRVGLWEGGATQEESVLFFVVKVHRIEIIKDNNVDAESQIHFAISGVIPTPR